MRYFTYVEPFDASASTRDGTERRALLWEALEIVETLIGGDIGGRITDIA